MALATAERRAGKLLEEAFAACGPSIPPEIRPLFLPEYPYFSRFPAVELSGRLGDFCTGPFRSSRCLVGKVRGRDRIYLSRL